MYTESCTMIISGPRARFLLSLSFFSFFFFELESVSVGSDGAVSRQGSVEFPEADSDNMMKGFAAFENGFTFETASTSCTFDSFFPVSGTVNMKGGTLYLLKDLIFDSEASINGMGDIYGNGNLLQFSESITTLSNSALIDNTVMSLDNNILWKMATVIQDECSIDGKNNIMTVEDAGAVTVTTGAQLTLKNLELKGLTGENFKCHSDDASIVFENCKIRLDHDFAFATGSILFEGETVFTGTNKFIYSSSRTSTIAAGAKVIFDHGTTFKYNPSVANRDLIYMTNDTSSICLNGCTLHSTATGVRLTRGKLILDNLVTLSAEGSNVSESICFGNGIASGDLTVKVLSDVDLDVYGEFYYDNVN